MNVERKSSGKSKVMVKDLKKDEAEHKQDAARLTAYAAVVLFALSMLAVPVFAQDAGDTAGTASSSDDAGTRLKELIVIEGMAPVQLTGYGIVIGLDRTGDRARGSKGSPYTVQSIANMLQRYGITVNPNDLSARNTAAVMVTASMGPFVGAGGFLDVTVASIGDARSLSGGVLLQTPLVNPLTQEVHAMATGPVSTGSVLASSNGTSVQVNHTNTGRVPNSATVIKPLAIDMSNVESMALLMKDPDFTNATRVVEAINQQYADAAEAEHAGRIRVAIPNDAGGAAAFMASLEELRITVDIPARVVINERTGTIVAGGNVRISEVMVTYGSLVIATQTDPFVSQPQPFSQTGETVSGEVGSANIQEETTRSVVLTPNTNVNQLAAALNELGLTARDVIAIFQNIDRAGALQGELIIL